MKKDKIIFWTATIIIALFEGVMPALTSQTELAKEELDIWAIHHILEMR
jgi:hypothetical protein